MTTDVLDRAARIRRRSLELEQEGRHELASELRRTTTRADPMLFALVYLRRHLADALGAVTLSEVHLAWAASATSWMTPAEPAADRRGEVAPRTRLVCQWRLLSVHQDAD